MPRYAMTIDLDRCVGCQACTVACKAENDVPDPLWRLSVQEQSGQGARAAVSFSHAQCFHCENPACLDMCPTGATYKDANGIIRLDRDVCINCGYCVTACPYAARHFDSGAGAVQKCDLCAHRLADGRPTACVEVCPTGARLVGDLDKQDSPVARSAASAQASVFKPELGQQPKLFYLAKSGEMTALAMNALPERGAVPLMVDVWRRVARPVGVLGMPLSAAAVLLALPVAWRNARMHGKSAPSSAPAAAQPAQAKPGTVSPAPKQASPDLAPSAAQTPSQGKSPAKAPAAATKPAAKKEGADVRH